MQPSMIGIITISPNNNMNQEHTELELLKKLIDANASIDAFNHIKKTAKTAGKHIAALDNQFITSEEFQDKIAEMQQKQFAKIRSNIPAIERVEVGTSLYEPALKLFKGDQCVGIQ